MNEYLSLLERMVNIDSGTGDPEGFPELAGILREKAAGLKLSFQTLTGADGSQHYYWRGGQGRRTLLVAHLDTVFPKGTANTRRFAIAGDLARGPGVSDCKSGVVTIIGALERLAEKSQWPAPGISCLFNTDEEIGSPGSRSLIEKLAGEAGTVLVVEPAEGENLTIARKGIGRFRLEVFGKAAHSGSNYGDGSNAILELARKIIAVQGLTRPEQGITLNVGVVSGGVRPNIIPDYATAEIDLRIKTNEQAERLIAALREIRTENSVPGTSAELSGGITRPPWESTLGGRELFKRFQLIGKKIGLELGAFESGGGSDANLAATTGVPTIDGLGPVGGGHHSEDEYLVIPSLWRRIELLAEFLKRLPEN